MGSSNRIAKIVESCSVLVVDDNHYSRKLIRMLLANIGIKKVHEAADGLACLEAIRAVGPDVVILDWEMPLLNGAELVRIVRSPGVFPMPDIPIVMISGHGERWRVVEAMRLGVNEFLIKPVSAKALRDRMLSILAKPRRTVQCGHYYGPEPRGRFMAAVSTPMRVNAEAAAG
jgi:two-component system chemotaxis response regulator CheY